MTLSFFGLWSNENLHSARSPSRSIATQSKNKVNNLLPPSLQTVLQNEKEEVFQTEKLIKLKNKIWNKVLSAHDFENFNDQEYFRWMEIYKDVNEELSNLNPVKIEQKMALIEIINKRLIQTTLFYKKNQTEEGQKINTYRLQKLQNHMANFDINLIPKRSDIHNFAADLMIILKNPPSSLMDYFIDNKTEKMNAGLMRMVQEDILLIGLKGMLVRIPDKNSDLNLKQTKLMVKKLFQHKIWKLSISPNDILWLEKVNLPEELLEKIMIDGLESHDQELIAYFQKKNMIDHYERFRKVYKTIAFSIGLYFYIEKFNTTLNPKPGLKAEEEGVKIVNFFKSISDIVLDTNSPLEAETI